MNTTGFPMVLNCLLNDTIKDLPVTWSFQETLDSYSLQLTWKKLEPAYNSEPTLSSIVHTTQTIPSRDVQTTQTTPSRDVQPTQTTPPRDVQTTPSRDVQTTQTTPPRDVQTTQTTPPRDVQTTGTTPPRDVQTTQTTPPRDVQMTQTTPSRDVQTTQTAPSRFVQTTQTSPSRFVQTTQISLSRVVQTTQTTPSRDLQTKQPSPSRDVKTTQTTPSKDVQTKQPTPSIVLQKFDFSSKTTFDFTNRTTESTMVKDAILTPAIQPCVNVATSTKCDFRYSELFCPNNYTELLPEKDEDWQHEVFYHRADKTCYIVMRHKHLLVLGKKQKGLLLAIRPVNVILRRGQFNEGYKRKFDEYLDWVEQLEPFYFYPSADIEKDIGCVKEELQCASAGFPFYTWNIGGPIEIPVIGDS